MFDAALFDAEIFDTESVAAPALHVQPSGGWFLRPRREEEQEEAAPQAPEAARPGAEPPPVGSPAEAAPITKDRVISKPLFLYKPHDLEQISREAKDAYLEEHERLAEARRQRKKRQDAELLLLF